MPRQLLVMALAAVTVGAGCGSSSEQPIAGVLPEDAEYGDSLDEYFDSVGAEPTVDSAAPAGFTELQWEDLIPPGYSGDEIYARFEEKLAGVEPGSAEVDAIYAEMRAEYDNAAVNPELVGNDVLLAGFVAPLTYSGDLVTEFLLVPYFGACIHVPPPPPNQTVLVTLEEGRGLPIEESWGAVWVTGTLTIDAAETDLANAGYSITAAQTGVHQSY